MATQKKLANSPQKQQDSSKRFKANASTSQPDHDSVAILIRQTVDAQRDSLSDMVASMLAGALETALGPLEKLV